jgi:hypothetical protein
MKDRPAPSKPDYGGMEIKQSGKHLHLEPSKYREFASPPKPAMPEEGARLSCLHCGTISAYKTYMIYAIAAIRRRRVLSLSAILGGASPAS